MGRIRSFIREISREILGGDDRSLFSSIVRLIKIAFFGRGWRPILLWIRIRSALYNSGKIKLSNLVTSYIERRYACHISPEASLGREFVMPHPTGIVIGKHVKIGDGCKVYQNVTLGSGRGDSDEKDYPEIGNAVVIFAGAVVVGAVKIGSGAMIGANAVVLRDVPENTLAVGIPAKIVGITN